MNALILFLKKPVLGKVKTRIAKECGDLHALNIYKEIAQISINNVSSFPNLFVCSDFPLDKNDFALPQNASYMLQVKDQSLGIKMIAAVEVVRNMGYEKVGIMGADCPDISMKIIERGFHALDAHDIALGPSEDGGFYFLTCNLSTDLGKLFRNVKWSTNDVYLKIIQNAAAINYVVFSGRILFDIDFKSDYERFQKQNEVNKVS